MKIDHKLAVVRALCVVVITLALGTGTVLTQQACATPASVAGQSTANLTAPGIQALHAKEAVKYLDIVRDLAIDGNTAGKIPQATTERIVRWHKAALATIAQTPNGWKPSVLTGIDEMQKTLTPDEHAIFDPYILSAKTVIVAVIS